jgi:hypothetical protein
MDMADRPNRKVAPWKITGGASAMIRAAHARIDATFVRPKPKAKDQKPVEPKT